MRVYKGVNSSVKTELREGVHLRICSQLLVFGS